MKTTIFTLAVVAGTIFTGCESLSEKKEAAQENVQSAKEDLKEAQDDLNTEAYNQAKAEEWAAFKIETEKKIAKNEDRITKLKEANKKTGKTFDALIEKRIGVLEEKNKDLKARITVYAKSREGWDAFKREWNHDMDELGQALENLTVDNKK